MNAAKSGLRILVSGEQVAGYFDGVRSRENMTVRRVAQGSPEAGDARVGGSADERLALLSLLSLSSWANSGRPLPMYRRQDMPIVRTTLRARSDRD